MEGVIFEECPKEYCFTERFAYIYINASNFVESHTSFLSSSQILLFIYFLFLIFSNRHQIALWFLSYWFLAILTAYSNASFPLQLHLHCSPLTVTLLVVYAKTTIHANALKPINSSDSTKRCA